MRVSHETIYQSLFVQARGVFRKELTRYLRRGRAQRRPRRRSVGGELVGMVLLSERPAEAADRAVPGHWEGDLIMGTARRSAIATLVERQTRYVMLIALPDGRTADQVRIAIGRRVLTLPEQLRRTLTWDRGKEMAEHARFRIDCAVPLFHQAAFRSYSWISPPSTGRLTTGPRSSMGRRFAGSGTSSSSVRCGRAAL